MQRLIFILGVNIPVNENIVPQQSLLQTQQQREIADKEDSERHQHSRQDVWTFPEGSSVMAQNGVPLIPSNHLNPSNASQAALPIACLLYTSPSPRDS